MTKLPQALFLAVALPAVAQDDSHAACAAVGWVPREILERPVALRSGVGNARESVTTTSPEAQAFYDQGLNYLHGYVWIEAARSFQQALRHDPGLAMAHLGLSRVYSGLDDPESARRELAAAQARAPRDQRSRAAPHRGACETTRGAGRSGRHGEAPRIQESDR